MKEEAFPGSENCQIIVRLSQNPGSLRTSYIVPMCTNFKGVELRKSLAEKYVK